MPGRATAPPPVPVRRGDIEIVDSGVVRLAEQVDGLVVRECPPMARGERPDPEADLRNLEFGLAHGAVVQQRLSRRPQTRLPYLTAPLPRSTPRYEEERRKAHQLRRIEDEHWNRDGRTDVAVVHRDVEVHRREILEKEQGGEDDEADRKRRTQAAVVPDVDVQETQEEGDADHREPEVDHPERSDRQAITARRGSGPYLFFPQPRLHPTPDFKGILEMDLEPPGQGVQGAVALVPQGHDTVVLADHCQGMTNRPVVQT